MAKKVCLLLLLLSLWSHCVFAGGISIVVSPESKIEGEFITLGQIAEISGDDAPWVNSLRQIKLGNAPPPGSSTVLTKDILNMRLAAAGSDFSGIVWKIPDAITVTTNCQSISGQAVIRKGIAAIQQQIGDSVTSEDMSIVPIGSVQDIAAPIGNVVLTPSLPYGIHYNVPTIVTVGVSVNEQPISKVNLKFNIKLYRQVAVANSQIGVGEILTVDNVRYERMDVGKLETGYFTDLNKVLGLAARRSFSPGMVIMDSSVSKPVLVKRGSTVNIVAYIGDMTVTAVGQAMQDGSEGQLIRVQNSNSMKIITGKVVDGNTVQVLTI